MSLMQCHSLFVESLCRTALNLHMLSDSTASLGRLLKSSRRKVGALRPYLTRRTHTPEAAPGRVAILPVRL